MDTGGSAADVGAAQRAREVAHRTHRRHAVLAADGIDGVFQVATALRASGQRVRDFTAEVREGVGLSCLTCTVSVTVAESELLVDRLRRIPSVVSVDPC